MSRVDDIKATTLMLTDSDGREYVELSDENFDWLVERVGRLECVLGDVLRTAIPQYRAVAGQPELTTFDGLVPEGVMQEVESALAALDGDE